MLISCQESEITEEKAVKIAKSFVEKNLMGQKEEIIYFDSPIVEELEFEDSYIVYYADRKNQELQEIDLKGKTVWRVIYTTNLDARLGPNTIFIDKYSGKIYGFLMRY